LASPYRLLLLPSAVIVSAPPVEVVIVLASPYRLLLLPSAVIVSAPPVEVVITLASPYRVLLEPVALRVSAPPVESPITRASPLISSALNEIPTYIKKRRQEKINLDAEIYYKKLEIKKLDLEKEREKRSKI